MVTGAGRAGDARHDAIAEMAATWFVRQASGDWSESEEHELTAWLQAHATHRREFEAFQSLWAELDEIVPSRTGAGGRVVSRWRAGRRWFTWGVAAACAVVALTLTALLASHRSGLAIHQQILTTAPRQRLEVPLPDGSKLVLNISSSAAVTYYRDRREVSLMRGEAFFEVRPDADRPFVVRAREVTIRVVGTRFNVYLAPADVRISVAEGKVEVWRDEELPSAPLVIRSGEGVRVGTAVTRHAARPADVGAWRSGQVVFRDQSLADVLAEVGRYRAAAIALATPDLGQRRLSGVFNVDNPEGFLDALPQILPLRVQRRPDGAVTISAVE
jgi:transmembrane sensor